MLGSLKVLSLTGMMLMTTFYFTNRVSAQTECITTDTGNVICGKPLDARISCSNVIKEGKKLKWTTYKDGKHFNHGTLTITKFHDDGTWLGTEVNENFNNHIENIEGHISGNTFIANNLRWSLKWTGVCERNGIIGDIRDTTRNVDYNFSIR